MKNLKPYIFIFCVLLGCDAQEEKTENAQSLSLVPLEKEYIGTWVHKAYLADLEATKSTKKAQELGRDKLYRITENQEIMYMTLHEGAGGNRLLMNAKNEGAIYAQDTSIKYSEVRFQEGIMRVENKTFVKVEGFGDSFAKLINQTFFAGTYKMGGETVLFNPNGNIKGLSGFTRYRLNTDYMDAGMQFDKIYLSPGDPQIEETFLYKFVGDTLLIKEPVCVEWDDERTHCYEIEQGKVIYKLRKLS